MMLHILAQTDVIGAAGPDLVPPVWRTLGALLVVLALLGALAWMARRGGFARRASGGLSVESALPLGDRRSLVVVTVENRRLLLAKYRDNDMNCPGSAAAVAAIRAASAGLRSGMAARTSPEA